MRTFSVEIDNAGKSPCSNKITRKDSNLSRNVNFSLCAFILFEVCIIDRNKSFHAKAAQPIEIAKIPQMNSL